MCAQRKKIIIVGGGPAGMMAAIELSKHHEVHLFEKGKTLGRKFLVAGKGGFNLCNSNIEENLYNKYTPQEFLAPILSNFDSNKTISWLAELGIDTFVGSSGRVFPIKGTKPIDVLNVLKNKILTQGVTIHFEHEFINFNSEKIEFSHSKNQLSANYDYCIFALGGASWSVTGSKGDWLPIFNKNNINTKPFEASNCGLTIDFPAEFLKEYTDFL
jgi:predicted Rossmann fold flavoprotein